MTSQVSYVQHEVYTYSNTSNKTSRYNDDDMDNILSNTQNRHPIAHPWGTYLWGALCKFKVWPMFYHL